MSAEDLAPPDVVLTAAQRAAIYGPDRDCAVVASAGAGKTLVLIERAVWLLATGRCDLDGLVCITFTNKAAEELKDRLRQRLGGLTGSHARWREVLDRLDRARISTIHAFCARLLRENPVEAAVDPHFVTLEGPESLALRRETADAAVLEALESGRVEAARLVAVLGRDGLVETVLALDEAMRVAGAATGAVRRRTAASLEAVRADWARRRDAWLAAAAGYLAAAAPTPAARARQDEFRRRWDGGLRDRVERLEPGLDAETRHGLAELEAAVRAATPRNLPAALRDRGAALREAAGAVIAAAWELATAPLADELLRLADAFGRAYAAAKALRGALDFHDLQGRALHLLRSRPAIRDAYRRRFRYVMVDEFQDTDGLQAEILAELAGGDGPRPWLMVVGDPKQSIYRFRGADVEIFRRTAAEMEARGGVVVRLDENFRSRPPLVRLTNAVFRAIRDLPDGGISPDLLEFREAAALRSGPAPAGCAPGAPASGGPAPGPPDEPALAELVLVTVPEEYDRELQVDEEARAVAEWIAAAVEGSGPIVVAERLPDGTERDRRARWGDVCILLRAGTHAWRYERALRLAGIPYHSLVTKGFFQRQEILDARYWLQAVEAPGDDWAWFAALRSPAFALSDETLFWLAQGPRPLSRALELWPAEHPEAARSLAPGQEALLLRAREVLGWARRVRDRVSPADVLEGILDATGLRAVLLARHGGEQAVANLEKLVAVARAFAAEAPRTGGDFLAALERAYDPRDEEGEAVLAGGDADAVRILSIHRAKGLEFPIVVLAGAGDELRGGWAGRAAPVLLDPEAGLVTNLARKLGSENIVPPRWAAADGRRRTLDHHEQQRLLYVALTRARDYLAVFGTGKTLDIQAAFPDQKRWLDWLCRVVRIADADAAPPEAVLDAGNGAAARIRVVTRKVEPEAVTGEILAAEDPGAADAGAPPAGPAAEPAVFAAEPADPEAEAEIIVRRALPLPPPLPRLPAVSVTQLLAFRRCPRGYAVRYLLGVPEVPGWLPEGPEGDGLAGRLLVAHDVAAGLEGGGKPSGDGPDAGESPAEAAEPSVDPLLRGLVAHRACELLGPPDGPQERSAGATGARGAVLGAAAALDRAAALVGVPVAAREGLRKDLLPLLEGYLAGPRYAALTGAAWVRSELAFTWRVDGHGAPPSVLLHGVMDKAYAGPDGRVTILDFKTDRVAAGEVAARAERYRLQLHLYALAGVELFGWDVARCVLHFMEPQAEHAWEITPEGLARVREELAEAVAALFGLEEAWAAASNLPAGPWPAVAAPPAGDPTPRLHALLGEGCGACPHPSLCAALGGAYAAASSKTASGR